MERKLEWDKNGSIYRATSQRPPDGSAFFYQITQDEVTRCFVLFDSDSELVDGSAAAKAYFPDPQSAQLACQEIEDRLTVDAEKAAVIERARLNDAVDAFARAMKKKLESMISKKQGWDDPDELREYVAKLVGDVARLAAGDYAQAVDVANYAMFINLILIAES